MPFRSDVSSVLSLAQNVADDFSRAPSVFSSGESATNEFIAELNAYQQLNSSRNNSHPNNQSNFESSLTANLQPCRDTLRNMLDIRLKYGRDAKLGTMESVRWRLDEKRFEQEVVTLRQDTARLRELVRELQRAALTSTTQRQVREEYNPNRDGTLGAPVLQTTVSIMGAQYASHPAPAQTQRTSTTSFASPNPFATPNRFASPNPFASQNSFPPQNGFTPQSSPPSQTSFHSQPPTLTEMCPNGSGCRRPRCHLDYLHPNAPKCDNGKNCGIPNCEKWHPKSAHCPKGPACPIVGCDKAHPWPREPASPPISYLPRENSFTPTTGGVMHSGGVVVVTSELFVLSYPAWLPCYPLIIMLLT